MCKETNGNRIERYRHIPENLQLVYNVVDNDVSVEISPLLVCNQFYQNTLNVHENQEACGHGWQGYVSGICTRGVPRYEKLQICTWREWPSQLVGRGSLLVGMDSFKWRRLAVYPMYPYCRGLQGCIPLGKWLINVNKRVTRNKSPVVWVITCEKPSTSWNAHCSTPRNRDGFLVKTFEEK